jgi:hypothetical protein
MNNILFINNLKKNQQQKIQNNINSPSILNKIPIHNDDIDINAKYNPDVNNKYVLLEKNRTNFNYSYSTDVWKPIIGSVSNVNDIKIKLDTLNTDEIRKKYELELENRQKENEIVKQMIDEQNKTKSISNTNLPNISTLQVNISNVNNPNKTFDELKEVSIKNKSILMDSMVKLDNILDSLKNL